MIKRSEQQVIKKISIWLAYIALTLFFANCKAQPQTPQQIAGEYSKLVYLASQVIEEVNGAGRVELIEKIENSNLLADDSILGKIFQTIIRETLASRGLLSSTLTINQYNLSEQNWAYLQSIDTELYAANRSFYIYIHGVNVESTPNKRVAITIPQLQNLKQQIIELGDKHAIAIVSARLGEEIEEISLLKALSEYEYALPYLRKFDPLRPMETQMSSIRVHHWIADIYNDLQLHMAALEHGNVLLSLLSEEEKKPLYINPSIYALNKLGRFDEALKLSDEAIRRAERNKNDIELFISKMLKISVLTHRNQQQDGVTILKLSKQMEQLIGNQPNESLVMYLKLARALASAIEESKEVEFERIVKDYADQANSFMNNSNHPGDVSLTIYHNLRRLYELNGNYDKAFYFGKLYQSARVNYNSEHFGIGNITPIDSLTRDIEIAKFRNELSMQEKAELKKENLNLQLIIFILLFSLLATATFMFWLDKRALKRIAETDTLTGAKTRRAMYKLAEKALQFNNSTCFVLVDLDHFKQINDSYGHLAGDEVLKGFSNVVSERIRETDLFCRYGGEEFLLILNNLDKKTAVTLVDGIREKFEGINSWKELDSTTNVSFSAGVVEINQVSNIDCIIKQCDGLLYKAKANGRAKTES